MNVIDGQAGRVRYYSLIFYSLTINNILNIIILLILAGISISALTNTGIFGKAKEAKEKSEAAEKQQSETLDSYEKELNKYTSDNLEENIGVKFEKNTELHDKNGAKIIVPAGFKVVNTDDLTVEKGIVVEDSKRNQYVWIPCTTEDSKSQLQFKRTEWDVEDDGGTRASKDELTLTGAKCSSSDITNGLTDDKLIEIVAQIKAEKESVSKNGGYYIGRYEVGDENGIAVIKADQTPMASIIWSTAYSKAKGIGGGPGATTYLCSSYAWDTAINFIQNNGFPNYAKAREDSYNENWEDKNVKDSKGNIIKAANKAERLPTGKTTPKCNIYDMGGNVSEFTTEVMPSTSEPLVLRGGGYNDSNPAGLRYDGHTSAASSNIGLRATLFLK